MNTKENTMHVLENIIKEKIDQVSGLREGMQQYNHHYDEKILRKQRGGGDHDNAMNNYNGYSMEEMNLKLLECTYDAAAAFRKKRHETTAISDKMTAFMVSIGNYISEYRDSASILDVGCGTGILLNYIPSRLLRQYKGLDLSLEMIKVARESFPEHEFIHSDYLKYYDSVTSGSRGFDVIVFNECFHYFVNHQEIIDKSINLLNRRGSIIISHPTGFTNVFSQHNKNHLMVPNLLPTIEKIKGYLSSHNDVDVRVSPDIKGQHYLCVLQRNGA